MSHDANELKDKRTEINRRKLLTGLSTLTVGLTSSIWRPTTAFGADTQTPGKKHFIAFFTGNGTVPEAFFPNSTGVESAPLTKTTILAPLEKLMAKINVMKGVNYNSMKEDILGNYDKGITANRVGIEHVQGPGVFLSGGYISPVLANGQNYYGVGSTTHMSLDQLLVKKFGGITHQYGVQSNDPRTTLGSISYSPTGFGNGMDQTIKLAPSDNPMDAYKLLGDPKAGQNSAAELQRILTEKRSMLDYINSELKSLSAKLSADDKILLDAHLSGVRDIEQRLMAVNSSQCTIPNQLPAHDTKDFRVMAKLQMDLLVLAHKCGTLRASTFTLGHSNSYVNYDFLDFQGHKSYHHAMSHGYDPNLTTGIAPDQVEQLKKDYHQNLIKINVFHAAQFMYLLEQLNAVPDSDGRTLLDNSAVLWGSEIGDGGHTYKNIPFILAGSAGGYFKTGRYLDYTLNKSPGLPHNNLLLSIAHAMGMSDLKSIGVPGVCTGPLRGLAA